MDLIQRKQWNENHKQLTNIITKPEKHRETIDLFLYQHSLLHSSEMSQSADITLEDALTQDIHEETIRRYPVVAPDTKNSIAWHIWHITRIEDMTMNILVNNGMQVFHTGDWDRKLGIDYPHSGNEMTDDEIAHLSRHVDIPALFEYRIEVGRKTREVVSLLKPGDFKLKVDAARIQKLKEQNAVTDKAAWLLDYWGKKNIAGLILMPATRHIFFAFE